jgi:hypothetical protein
VGEITGCWLEEEQKIDILLLIESAKQQGFPMTRVCSLMMISRRRTVRWQRRWKEGEGLKNLTPGPKHPLHTLLPMERRAVLQMAKSEEYTDLSHRILTVTGWDLGLFFVSFSSVLTRQLNRQPIQHRQFLDA